MITTYTKKIITTNIASPLTPTPTTTALLRKKQKSSLLLLSSSSSSLSRSSFSSLGAANIAATHWNVTGASLKFKNLLVVIKQTAFEEYSQLRLRGQAPKALRWKRLEQRYKAHKQCVTGLLEILHAHNVERFSCVNRVELDRQHLADVDLMIAVGGDGTVLSAAHLLDHGTIPLLGINSDPNVTLEDRITVKKTSDERRSHGALCMCTAIDMEQELVKALYGGGYIHPLTRIRCQVKSTFSETRLSPALNDILLANPSPAAVSRFRMGWLNEINEQQINPNQMQQQQQQQQQQHSQQHELSSLQITSYNDNTNNGTATTSDTKSPNNDNNNNNNNLSQKQQQQPIDTTLTTNHNSKKANGTITRFGGATYNVEDSINVWSSGMWISTATGSTAAMKAAGGQVMDYDDPSLQYIIREHMIEPRHLQALQEQAISEGRIFDVQKDINNGLITNGAKLHVRWNSQRGRIFIDGSHLTHDLELGDEILIDNKAPPLKMFTRYHNND